MQLLYAHTTRQEKKQKRRKIEEVGGRLIHAYTFPTIPLSYTLDRARADRREAQDGEERRSFSSHRRRHTIRD